MSDTRKSLNSRCIDTFDKAIRRVEELVSKETLTADYDQIHSAKSILYAAIERVGLRAERTLYVQRMLRELLLMVNQSASAGKYDKEVVLTMLEELKDRYRKDIFLS